MPTFETYDFEGDSRWKEYKTNTDVPHVSDAEGVEYRLKLRFYKKYIDPTYDPYRKEAPPTTNNNTSSSSSQSSSRPTSSSTSNNTSNAPRRGVDAVQYVWLISHISVVLHGVFYLLPLLGTSEGNYARAFYSATIAHGISLFNAVGVPRFNQETLQRVMLNDSTQYLMLYLMLSTYPPFFLALVPPVVYSFFHVCNFLSTNHASLPPAVAGIYSQEFDLFCKEQYALMWATQMEVMTMFAIVFNTLIGYGSLILCLGYYWFLTFRYMINYQTRMICDALGVKLDQIFYGPSSPAIVQKIYGMIRNFLRNSIQRRMQ